jgi:SAM-dependent methyltransferase
VSAAHVADELLALEPAGSPARNLALRALHALGEAERRDLHRWCWDLLATAESGGAADTGVIGDVLDVGAGSAQPWLAYRGPIPSGWRITLLDRAPEMVASAQRALADLGHPATGVVADAVALPFPDASFDLVLAHHVLYHLPERDRAVAELRRVLRRGGRLVAATNGGDHLAEAVALLGEVRRAWPALRVTTPEPLAFTLENGAAQLAPPFGDVVRFVRPPVAVGVPAGAVARYLLAQAFARDAVEAAEVAAWVDGLVAACAGDAAMEVRRVSGAFVAR